MRLEIIAKTRTRKGMMNIKLNRIIALATLLMGVFQLSAQNENNPITTATPFLTISPDSRGSALGDAGVASTPDLTSQYWNASKYAFMEEDFGFSFSLTPWLRALVNDINLFYATGYKKFGDLQAVSASLRYFSLGDIQWTSSQGDILGSISPNEFALDAAYSRKFSDTWSGAVTFRYIHSDLTGGAAVDLAGSSQQYYPGNSFAADISAFYTDEIDLGAVPTTVGFGVNLSNIGNKMSYTKGEFLEFLPSNFKIGTSWTFTIDEYNKIAAMVDINKLMVPTPDKENDPDGEIRNDMGVMEGIFSSWNDAPGGFSEELRELTYSVGTEYIYDEMFVIRAGYFYEDENKGNREYVSFGAGFKMNVFGLDVSYLVPMDTGSPLGSTLRFTLSFGVDGLQSLMGR